MTSYPVMWGLFPRSLYIRIQRSCWARNVFCLFVPTIWAESGKVKADDLLVSGLYHGLSRRSRFELRTSTKKSRKIVVSMVATTTTFDLTTAAGEHTPSSAGWRPAEPQFGCASLQAVVSSLRSRRSSYQPWYRSSYRQECATGGQGWREADFCNLALWYLYQMSSHLGKFCWFTFSKHRCQANLSYGWKMWWRVRDGGYVSIFPQGWCSKLHVSFWGV